MYLIVIIYLIIWT